MDKQRTDQGPPTDERGMPLPLRPRTIDLSFSGKAEGFTPMKLPPGDYDFNDLDDEDSDNAERQRRITAEDVCSSIELFNPDLCLTPSMSKPRSRTHSTNSINKTGGDTAEESVSRWRAASAESAASSCNSKTIGRVGVGGHAPAGSQQRLVEDRTPDGLSKLNHTPDHSRVLNRSEDETQSMKQEAARLHSFLDKVQSEMEAATTSGKLPATPVIKADPPGSPDSGMEGNDLMVEKLRIRMQQQKQNELDIAAAEWSAQKRNIYELQDNMDTRVSSLQREIIQLRHKLSEAEESAILLHQKRVAAENTVARLEEQNRSLEGENVELARSSKVALDWFQKAKDSNLKIVEHVQKLANITVSEPKSVEYVQCFVELVTELKETNSWMYTERVEREQLPDLTQFSKQSTWKVASQGSQSQSFDTSEVLTRVAKCETNIEKLQNAVVNIAPPKQQNHHSDADEVQKNENKDGSGVLNLKDLKDFESKSQDTKQVEHDANPGATVEHLRNVIKLLHAENLRLDNENQRLGMEREEYHTAYMAATNEVTHVRQHGEQLYKLFKGYQSQYFDAEERTQNDPENKSVKPTVQQPRNRPRKGLSTKRDTGMNVKQVVSPTKPSQKTKSTTTPTPTARNRKKADRHLDHGSGRDRKLRHSDLIDKPTANESDRVEELLGRVGKLKHTLKRIFVWGQRESEARSVAEEELRTVKQLLRRINKDEKALEASNSEQNIELSTPFLTRRFA